MNSPRLTQINFSTFKFAKTSPGVKTRRKFSISVFSQHHRSVQSPGFASHISISGINYDRNFGNNFEISIQFSHLNKSYVEITLWHRPLHHPLDTPRPLILSAVRQTLSPSWTPCTPSYSPNWTFVSSPSLETFAKFWHRIPHSFPKRYNFYKFETLSSTGIWSLPWPRFHAGCPPTNNSKNLASVPARRPSPNKSPGFRWVAETWSSSRWGRKVGNCPHWEVSHAAWVGGRGPERGRILIPWWNAVLSTDQREGRGFRKGRDRWRGPWPWSIFGSCWTKVSVWEGGRSHWGGGRSIFPTFWVLPGSGELSRAHPHRKFPKFWDLSASVRFGGGGSKMWVGHPRPRCYWLIRRWGGDKCG